MPEQGFTGQLNMIPNPLLTPEQADPATVVEPEQSAANVDVLDVLEGINNQELKDTQVASMGEAPRKNGKTICRPPSINWNNRSKPQLPSKGEQNASKVFTFWSNSMSVSDKNDTDYWRSKILTEGYEAVERSLIDETDSQALFFSRKALSEHRESVKYHDDRRREEREKRSLELSEEANNISRQAKRWAIWSAIIALLSAAIAAIALSSGNG